MRKKAQRCTKAYLPTWDCEYRDCILSVEEIGRWKMKSVIWKNTFQGVFTVEVLTMYLTFESTRWFRIHRSNHRQQKYATEKIVDGEQETQER